MTGVIVGMTGVIVGMTGVIVGMTGAIVGMTGVDVPSVGVTSSLGGMGRVNPFFFWKTEVFWEAKGRSRCCQNL